MRLLLRNLLDNALRHGAGAAQAPELHLQPDGAGIRITVRDHGPGVPEAQLPHLAEPFFRPDSARSRTQGGVGQMGTIQTTGPQRNSASMNRTTCRIATIRPLNTRVVKEPKRELQDGETVERDPSEPSEPEETAEPAR